MSKKGKLVILISGEGTNLQAIIDAIANKQLTAKICAVISNQKAAPGLNKAKRAGITTHILTNNNFANRAAYDTKLQALIDQYQPDFVILAGFMRILSTEFVQHYYAKLINIHPSLLPEYRGLNTHERVLAAGETQHGTTVHFVTDKLDGGPIIAQARCVVASDETVENLTNKIKSLEHQLYPQIIQWLSTGRLRLDEKGVTLDNGLLSTQGYQAKL